MNNDKERFYEAESKTQVSLGSAEAKKRSDEVQLFRKALQRQNERTAGMKMPDNMEQRVMERIRPKKVIRRWLYPSIATIAASVLLLLVFRFSQWPVEEQPIVQQPVVAETIEQSTPQPTVSEPIVQEKQEEALPEVQPTPQPVKKRRKAVKKQTTPIEEPQLATASATSATEDVKLATTADSLYYYLTELENQMGDCRDSTCLAELGNLMRADERIKGLVQKIIHKQVETAYQEEYLVDTTTHYIPL